MFIFTALLILTFRIHLYSESIYT